MPARPLPVGGVPFRLDSKGREGSHHQGNLARRTPSVRPSLALGSEGRASGQASNIINPVRASSFQHIPSYHFPPRDPSTHHYLTSSQLQHTTDTFIMAAAASLRMSSSRMMTMAPKPSFAGIAQRGIAPRHTIGGQRWYTESPKANTTGPTAGSVSLRDTLRCPFQYVAPAVKDNY